MNIPVCECGCGQHVIRSKRNPNKWNRFIAGHQCIGRQLSSESRRKMALARQKYTKENAPTWKGGRRVNHHGYIEIFMPEHPRARGNGYVFEHIVVMERKVGRYVKSSEHVHHKDHNRQNNDPNNLELLTPHEHGKLHSRKREGLYKTCPVCGSEFYVKRSSYKRRITCSQSCSGVYFRELYTGKPRDYKSSLSEKQEVIKCLTAQS